MPRVSTGNSSESLLLKHQIRAKIDFIVPRFTNYVYDKQYVRKSNSEIK